MHNLQEMTRFFSLTDVEKIPLTHPEYKEAVQAYFKHLFPHRNRQLIADPKGNPLSVDVEILYPTVEEPFYVLHTMGMSTAAMTYSAGGLLHGKQRYGELALLLPADWGFQQKDHVALDDPMSWPIWLLMELGRFPHVHRMWLSYYFTLSNTEDYRPFSPYAPFTGIAVIQFEGDLGQITLRGTEKIEILFPMLLYKEEIALCDTLGVETVIEHILDSNGDSFLVDIHRPNVGGHEYT